MSRDPRVLIIGEILVEIMAASPGHGFLKPMSLTGPFPSGAPAIFADQLARQGIATAMVSCVGRDDFGQLNLERLREAGVDVSAVTLHPTATTGIAFVRYRPEGGRDFLFHLADAACGQIVPTPEAKAQRERATHLHVMGSGLGASGLAGMVLDAAHAIKAAGGTLSFDPNLRPEVLDDAGRARIGEVLALADLVLPSEGEAAPLVPGAADEKNAIGRLVAEGRTVILKRGAAGASWISAGGQIDVPGFPIEEVDPTGAGDTFGATALAGWLMGADPATTLARACAAGAMAVARLGPMEGASDTARIDEFLADRKARA